MSLVLAGAEQDPAARLLSQLEQLGFSVLPASDDKVVMELCEHTVPEAVIVGSLDQARTLAAEHPRIPLVLLSPSLLVRRDFAGEELGRLVAQQRVVLGLPRCLIIGKQFAHGVYFPV